MPKGETPDVSTFTKVHYSETKTGSRTQICFTEDIPQLEGAPEQITAQVLDLNYEIAKPGIKKAETIEITMLYTHTQHKRMRELRGKELYFFFELPTNTADKPLVRYLQGTCDFTMDTISRGEFLKDKLTIYKSSDVEESEGFPTGE